jgi:hypothetical protein
MGGWLLISHANGTVYTGKEWGEQVTVYLKI